MKKTTRSQCFETNSSSTHVYSFSNLVKSRLDLTIIPNENNEIVIDIKGEWGFDLDATVHPTYKTSLLLFAAKSLFDQDKVDLVRSTVESFTGAKLKISGLSKVKKIEVNENDDYDDFYDMFSGLDSENSDPEDAVEKLKTYLKDEESIKYFIFCSKNSLDEEISYG